MKNIDPENLPYIGLRYKDEVFVKSIAGKEKEWYRNLRRIFIEKTR